MKRAGLVAVLLAVFVHGFLVTGAMYARGGRGGGGGGFSGGGRGGGGAGGARPSGGFSGGSMAGRTPSMSRPSSKPAMKMPSGGRQSFGNLPTPGTRPGGSASGSRPTSSLPNRPSSGISGRPGGSISNRPAAGLNRPGSIGNANARPGEISRAGNLPSRNDLNKFLDLPTGSGQLPSFGSSAARPSTREAGAGNAAEQFLRDRPTSFPGTKDLATNRPSTLPGTIPSRPGPGNLRPGVGEGNRPGSGEGLRPGGGEGLRPGGGQRPERIPDRDQWKDWRNDHRNNVWNHWHDNGHTFSNWYNHDWWDHHHCYYPYNAGFNYWAWAAWPSVIGWVGYGWSQPVYYYYGDNVYYENDTVYYGDQPVATSEEYAQQAAAIASSEPASKPAPEDWMPLGVFAITTDGKPGEADPSQYLQLAVSKQGVLSGTLQNSLTDSAQSIEGMVDKQTQRAAWTLAGKSWPIMETGISNLTQDTTPVLVHFADGTTQQWLLVRLDQPKTESGK
ncbi:MAG: hypothetical protein IT425_08735 [Pirellulales bacterium]|nr:hypothetical protein [Pirellulales bacterium]